MDTEEKKKYKYIFVVLTYRNDKDIVDFLKSLVRIKDRHVIIVNSYYDEKSKNSIELVARQFGCSFINVENKGYSFGNNKGIEYAVRNYDFKFLIISNPDIQIEKWNEKSLAQIENYAIGPIIISKKGTNQNGYWPFQLRFFEWLLYYAAKNNLNTVRIAASVSVKLIREIQFKVCKLLKKKYYRVYGLHGAFIILPKQVLDQITPVFDENMFLFAEEMVLAHKLDRISVKSVVSNQIMVNHKEDGSISLSNTNVVKQSNKSTIYYYEKYVK